MLHFHKNAEAISTKGARGEWQGASGKGRGARGEGRGFDVPTTWNTVFLVPTRKLTRDIHM